MSAMERVAKSFDAKVIANQTDPTDREFTAIVAAFNVVDDEGDVIHPGAFRGEIDKLRASGKSLPVIWDHQHKSIDSYIGEVVDIEELPPDDHRLNAAPHLIGKGGLWVRGVLDDDPAATKAHRLMKGGRISQFSFVALGGKAAPGQHEGRSVREIHEVHDLIEVGPTLRGMNTSTALLSIKSQPTGQPNAEPTDDPEGVSSDGDRARYLSLLSLFP